MINVLKTGIRAIQAINQSGVDTHAMAHFGVCWYPVGGTAAGCTRMELQPTLVPHVDVRCAFTPLERDIVTTIIRPEYPEFAADRTAALEHFCRWFRELYLDSATMTGCCVHGMRPGVFIGQPQWLVLIFRDIDYHRKQEERNRFRYARTIVQAGHRVTTDRSGPCEIRGLRSGDSFWS